MKGPHHREPFAQSYRDASIHQMMLEDAIRTSSYERAIQQMAPGQRVIDFGAGTGVLSIFAARSGAASVDAIERTSFVHHARRIARDSGHPEIRFHHADHESFQLDGQADLIVSEWMGHFLFYEAMLGPLISIRDRYLSAGGRMLPERLHLHAALLIDQAFHEECAFFQGNPYGINFSSIADQPLRQSRCVRVEPKQLCKRQFHLGTLDMATIKEVPACLSGSCRVEQACMAYGIAAWFSADLTDEIRFSTGPYDPPTHWDQMLFPFPEPFVAYPDRTITLEICPPRQGEDDDPTWAWSITDGVETRYVDEFDTVTSADDVQAEGSYDQAGS
ncbi:MAG TPA: methyltransferase domain-containing protein [Polyangiaceae bacterium]|nr:methyltransferase domain-containing protein [Polyangiaceae bacterium]